jgi:hypothetical protein
MNKLRWATILTVLAFCSALSFADGIPPDGNIGAKNGGKSTAITSLTGPMDFSSCTPTDSVPVVPADVAADCKLFLPTPTSPLSLEPQQIFAGINETGEPWNSLAVNLMNYNPIADPTVTCDGGAIFQHCSTSTSNCNPADTVCTLTVNFLQGTGTGVKCMLGVNFCGINSGINFVTNLITGSSLPYNSTVCDTAVPGAVCGPDEFVIGIGYGDDAEGHSNAFIQPLSLDATASADAPEPQTILLVGGAMISMLMLGLKKARIV